LQNKAYALFYLMTNSSSQLSSARFLWFPQKNWPFPVSPDVNHPDFTATVTALSYLCRM